MDALDIRIVRTMGIQPYGRSPKTLEALRPSVIAKKLGVSTELVRDRVARMEKSGLIGGYDAYPNHRQLGVEVAWFYKQFDNEDTVDAALEKLEPAEGVGVCCAFVGGLMCVSLVYRAQAELERRLRLVHALAGGGDFRRLFDPELPNVDRALTALDWRILRSLRVGANRPVGEVAKELRVSSKTVKRHLDRMAREGSLFVIPEFDPSRAEGLIFFYLLLQVEGEPGSVLSAVHRAFDDHLVSTDTLTARELGTHLLLLAAKSMAQVESLRRKALAVRGVSQARPLMFRAANENFSWIDEAIEDRLRMLAR